MSKSLKLVHIRSVGCLKRVEPTLHQPGLMSGVAQLASQGFRFSAMTLVMLLGPPPRSIQIFVQSRGQCAFALNLE